MRRILVAALAIPFLYLYVARLGPLWFCGLISVLGLVALYEFLAMVRVRGSMVVTGLAAGLGILASAALWTEAFPLVLLLCGAAVPVVRLFVDGRPADSLRETSVVVLALVYVPGLLSFQFSLRELDVQWVFMLYAGVWAADSCALYAGTFFGRNKLYPSMSPNKTVEGALGSLLGGAAAMLVMNLVYGFASHAGAALLGLAVSVAAQVGDLIESMFKRDAGIKDSSALIPGHGGVLDKLDAALVAAPVLVLWAKVIQ